MTANGWFQILLLFGLVLVAAKPMGVYMTHVFERERTWVDFLFRPLERGLYRLTGIDETHETGWTEYTIAMLVFSLVTMLATYLIERTQHGLPLNPQHLPAVPADLAWNTAVSFVEEQGLKGAPWPRHMYRQEKCDSSRASLTAAK